MTKSLNMASVARAGGKTSAAWYCLHRYKVAWDKAPILLGLESRLGVPGKGGTAWRIGLMTVRQLPDPGEERERGCGICRPVLRLDRTTGTGNH